MDILYYSNYCNNCKQVLEFIRQNSLIDKLACVSIDKRIRDPVSGQYQIELENGKRAILPPNVHSVPALLVVKDNYRAIFGGEIITYLTPKIRASVMAEFNGEPMGFAIGSSVANANIVSEQFTPYDMSPEDLSAKGSGSTRQLYNYVSANHDMSYKIPTPPDNYRPNKLDESATIDNLQKQRNMEVPTTQPPILGI
jgi:hypothetical protein